MKQLGLILVIGIMHACSSVTSLDKSQDVTSTPRATIIKQINKLNNDGSYTYGYESDDGSFKVETRSKGGIVKGKYGFIDPSGQLKTIEYTAGKKTPLVGELTSATETEMYSVHSDSREKNAGNSDDKSASSEKNSDENSKESSGEQDPPAFNSFDTQSGQKDQGETSELTKRQGQPNGPGSGVSGGFYGSQGQRFQGSPPYNPTTQLQGGQFVDTRGPIGFGGGAYPQQYFQGQGGQPQYFPGGPQQFSSGGFSQGGPQTHYVGRQYPSQYVGTLSNGISPSGGQFGTQGPPNQIQYQDPDGFVSGPPGNYYSNGPQRPQQFQYTGQNPQSLSYLQPGFQPGPYPGPGVQQQGRVQLNRLPIPGGIIRSPQTTVRGSTNSQQEYVPNPEIDGFSEDSDQDGFVDAYPGNEGSKEAADEKSPAVKSTTGDRPSSQYSPQVLGPQQVLQGGQGQTRPPVSSGVGLSPYNEQELQQLYNQQGLTRPTTSYQPQYPGLQPQLQSFPGQQYSPQVQFGSPQIRTNSYPSGQPQQYTNPTAYQGVPAGFPIQGQPIFVQGQPPSGTPQGLTFGGRDSRVLNLQGVNPVGQFPYDYVGGVGPNGFPLGGPQLQFVQQAQQLGQGQGLPSPPASQSQLTPTPGSAQVPTSDSKKESST